MINIAIAILYICNTSTIIYALKNDYSYRNNDNNKILVIIPCNNNDINNDTSNNISTVMIMILVIIIRIMIIVIPLDRKKHYLSYKQIMMT